MYSHLFLKQKQSLPLNSKIILSQKRIREFLEKMDGEVYVAFSGGKDSLVLLDIVRKIYPDVKAVFCDTGLEYPEIKDFVKTIGDVTTIRPKMHYKKVTEKYGYPVVSKEQALYIRQYRTTNSEYLKSVRWNGKDGRFKISEKWKYLVNAPFKISEQCCDVMKKRPMKLYERKNGGKPFLGNMASDSRIRKIIYLKTGCNSFNEGKEKSTPLGFWMEKDIWKYIKSKKLEYSSIYDKGVDRTGCIFCMFGIHMESCPNRFQCLEKTHPELYKYGMETLKLKEVLKYLNIEYATKKTSPIPLTDKSVSILGGIL